MNKRIIMSGNTLTAVIDGNIYTLTTATVEDYHKVLAAQTEDEVRQVIQPQLFKEIAAARKEVENIQAIHDGFKILTESGNFVEKDGSIYMDGTTRSIPELLIKEFAIALAQDDKDRYNSLKRFWLKCLINPNARSAEDLFVFLSHHNMKITKNGNFLAYRRVVSRESSNKVLVEFVSNQYTKLRARHKATGAFDVWENIDTKTPLLTMIGEAASDLKGSYELKGNLKQLYLDLPTLQEKGYTDAHTKTFDYRIGEIASIQRDAGDDNNLVSCSRGLHSSSKAYDYSGFGDTDILVIISPHSVLAVPKGQVGKLRTSAFYFACTLSYEERHILDNEDFDVTDLDDLFEEKLMCNLEEEVKKGFAEEVKRHTFSLPTINTVEITNICQDLKGVVANRVVNFYDDEDSYSDDDY